jgi:putative heme degradation protein
LEIERDSKPAHPPKEHKHTNSLIDHNIDAFSKISLQDKDYKYPFSDLLLRLRPGDWQEQLQNLNQQIATENEDQVKAKKVQQYWHPSFCHPSGQRW